MMPMQWRIGDPTPTFVEESVFATSYKTPYPTPEEVRQTLMDACGIPEAAADIRINTAIRNGDVRMLLRQTKRTVFWYLALDEERERRIGDRYTFHCLRHPVDKRPSLDPVHVARVAVMQYCDDNEVHPDLETLLIAFPESYDIPYAEGMEIARDALTRGGIVFDFEEDHLCVFLCEEVNNNG